MLRCRIDGVLRPTTCSPELDERREAGPTVKGQDCCQPELARSCAPPYEVVRATDDEQDSIAASQSCAGAIDAAIAGLDRGKGWLRRHEPARQGPSLVLSKHAFLI